MNKLLTAEYSLDEKDINGPCVSVDQHVGINQAVSKLAKIYEGGDAALIRAINANLDAFTVTVENKVAVRELSKTVNELLEWKKDVESDFRVRRHDRRQGDRRREGHKLPDAEDRRGAADRRKAVGE